MRSLRIVLMPLIAPAAPKRGLLARVALAAALAVTLLCMGGDEAQADSFNPTATVTVANTVADTPSDITCAIDIPEGDVWASSTTTFLPTGWQITPSSEGGIGGRGGPTGATPQHALFNHTY